MTELLTRPRKAGTRYPHNPTPTGLAAPATPPRKSPLDCAVNRTLLFTRLGGYTAGGS